MATPIPAFVSQWFPLSTSSIGGNGGNQVLLSTAFGSLWYYGISNRTTFSNGMSLLKALESALATSTGQSWTVRLATTYPFKVQFTNNGASSWDMQMSDDVAIAMGYTESNGFTISSGGGVGGATVASPLIWTPSMPISITGPVLFDPIVSYGVPTSVGAVQRAPDMTAAAVSNGVQWSAEYRFNGVQPYYKLRSSGTPYVNEDLETFWTQNLSKGRRVLMWRDRTNITGSSAPSAGSASPYNYVEYFPQPTLREQMPGTPMAPPNLVYWDVDLKFYVTENGETPLTV